MGSLIPSELTLDRSVSLNKPWIPQSTREFLAQVSKMYSVSDKISKLEDYVNRLEGEMKKIDAFKRELPLCMLLLDDAIAATKEEIMRFRNSDSMPVLEEFMPLKKSSPDVKDEKVDDDRETDIINRGEKMNWMSSVQLWNSGSHKKRLGEAVDRSSKNREAEKTIPSFKGCSSFPAIGKECGDEFPGAPSLSLRTPEIKNTTGNIFSSKSSSSRSGSSCGTNSQTSYKADSSRKQRRCWSPELHRRFVSALQQLGGAQAATPKQIRELMQVDGLTNDEVKSHLQKYRLHARRLPPPTNAGGDSSKRSNSHSSSPEGPFHGSSRATSVTVEERVEEEDDDKSESHSWKRSHKQSSSKREIYRMIGCPT